MTPLPLTRGLALAALLAAGVLAGCGSSDSGSSKSPPAKSSSSSSGSGGGTGGGSTVSLAADPAGAIKFDTTKAQAKAGTVTLVMKNASQVPHAIAVEGHGVDKDGATVTGGTSRVTVKLKPGTYSFYCPVDDHEKEGMKGTLTVR